MPSPGITWKEDKVGQIMNKFPAVQVVRKADGRRGLDVSTRYHDEWEAALDGWEKKGFVQVILKAPESPATQAQNNMFHALLGLWWKSGQHSFNGYDEMRNTVKARHGLSTVVEVDGTEYLYLKSWANYTKKARTQAIKGVISEMEQNGILDCGCTDEYQEIINGVKDV